MQMIFKIIATLCGMLMSFLLRRTSLGQMFLNLVFFNRIVHMWNSFPLDIRSSPTVTLFKSRVVNLLLHQQLTFS